MVKPNKVRTSITINPSLWESAKKYCKNQDEKLSFSELVEQLLTEHLSPNSEGE